MPNGLPSAWLTAITFGKFSAGFLYVPFFHCRLCRSHASTSMYSGPA
jgi:hypothetical protein